VHTDEYGITLSREVHICNQKLKGIGRFLAKMEDRYDLKTEIFVGEYRKGERRNSKDFSEWYEQYEALKRWESLKEQYDELYRMMR
jgi:hypothetical protein